MIFMLVASLRKVSIPSSLPWAIDLEDFHAITLVSGVYKIIAKVLANRLK